MLIKPREKGQEYEPIEFEIDGFVYTVISKIDSKLMKKFFKYNVELIRDPENVDANLKQMALLVNKPEDFFIKKNIDLRDSRFIVQKVMDIIESRDVKKNEKTP